MTNPIAQQISGMAQITVIYPGLFVNEVEAPLKKMACLDYTKKSMVVVGMEGSD